MVSCVENGKNFLMVSQKSMYNGIERDAATVGQVWQDSAPAASPVRVLQ